MVLFITQFKLSDIISNLMNYIANLNTPLSMIVIGTNLGAINLKEDWYDKLAWSGIFIRNLFFSIVILGILCVLPLPVIAKMTNLIMAACSAAGLEKNFYVESYCLIYLLKSLKVKNTF